MTGPDMTAGRATSSPAAVFTRILCGVDGSVEGHEAVSQASRLAYSSSEMILCGVWNTGSTVALGWSPPIARAPSSPRETIEAGIAAARLLLTNRPVVQENIVQGPAAPMLVAEADRRRATLAAVGTHDRSRLPGILLGSVPTELLHECPCSVLIARSPAGLPPFPRTIMVATDGSEGSRPAVQVAASLAIRLRADLQAVVATGGGDIDFAAVRAALDATGRPIPVQEHPGAPVAALCSLHPDLLVVGSRGLHGLRSLGSVSERVAHGAACSVLVVR
jgi:nucleotide-binding universal stress UspA family protein